MADDFSQDIGSYYGTPVTTNGAYMMVPQQSQNAMYPSTVPNTTSPMPVYSLSTGSVNLATTNQPQVHTYGTMQQTVPTVSGIRAPLNAQRMPGYGTMQPTAPLARQRMPSLVGTAAMGPSIVTSQYPGPTPVTSYGPVGMPGPAGYNVMSSPLTSTPTTTAAPTSTTATTTTAPSTAGYAGYYAGGSFILGPPVNAYAPGFNCNLSNSVHPGFSYQWCPPSPDRMGAQNIGVPMYHQNMAPPMPMYNIGPVQESGYRPPRRASSHHSTSFFKQQQVMPPSVQQSYKMDDMNNESPPIGGLREPLRPVAVSSAASCTNPGRRMNQQRRTPLRNTFSAATDLQSQGSSVPRNATAASAPSLPISVTPPQKPIRAPTRKLSSSSLPSRNGPKFVPMESPDMMPPAKPLSTKTYPATGMLPEAPMSNKMSPHTVDNLGDTWQNVLPRGGRLAPEMERNMNLAEIWHDVQRNY